MQTLTKDELMIVNGGSKFTDVLKETGNALLGAAGTAVGIVTGAGCIVTGNVPGAIGSGLAIASGVALIGESLEDAIDIVKED